MTFGDYQAYYETGALFRESSSNISWIGSIQSLLTMVGGRIVYAAGPFANYEEGARNRP